MGRVRHNLYGDFVELLVSLMRESSPSTRFVTD